MSLCSCPDCRNPNTAKDTRIAELEAEVERLRDCLIYLDRMGGLGSDKHNYIRKKLIKGDGNAENKP